MCNVQELQERKTVTARIKVLIKSMVNEESYDIRLATSLEANRIMDTMLAVITIKERAHGDELEHTHEH